MTTLTIAFIVSVYFITLGLFAWYSFINVKQTKTLLEWNDKTDIEINALKERNIDLEKRIKKMEHDLGMSVIEPEPDFGGKK